MYNLQGLHNLPANFYASGYFNYSPLGAALLLPSFSI